MEGIGSSIFPYFSSAAFTNEPTPDVVACKDLLFHFTNHLHTPKFLQLLGCSINHMKTHTYVKTTHITYVSCTWLHIT